MAQDTSTIFEMASILSLSVGAAINDPKLFGFSPFYTISAERSLTDSTWGVFDVHLGLSYRHGVINYDSIKDDSRRSIEDAVLHINELRFPLSAQFSLNNSRSLFIGTELAMVWTLATTNEGTATYFTPAPPGMGSTENHFISEPVKSRGINIGLGICAGYRHIKNSKYLFLLHLNFNETCFPYLSHRIPMLVMRMLQ